MNIIFELNEIINAFIGGTIIGLSAALLMLFQGKVAGVSGLISAFLSNPIKLQWHTLFLVGLVLGGLIARFVIPGAFPEAIPIDLAILIPAGFLVGFGTRLGSGCTSGHGVCGISRFSVRSILATLTFMTTGFITVYILYHIAGLSL
jgi:uncharacterized protein